MEEMELQSVRSYFRSLQKVSQVKVLFTVSYINVELLKSWMDTNLSWLTHQCRRWMTGWENTFFLWWVVQSLWTWAQKDAWLRLPRSYTCIFTPKQLLRAAAELQEGGWRSRNTSPRIIQSYTTDHQSEYSVENATTELQSEEYWRCSKKTRRIHDKVHTSRLLWPRLHEGVAVWCHTTMASCEGCHYSTVVWSRPATCSSNALRSEAGSFNKEILTSSAA